jgi:hypothetical protein
MLGGREARKALAMILTGAVLVIFLAWLVAAF